MAEFSDNIQQIFEYYGRQRDRAEQDMVVQMLKELQDEEGFLTEELKKKAAETAGVNLSMINLLIRVYPSLKQASISHVITVCTGERCAKKNGAAILDCVKKELKIGKDKLSADKKWLLKTQNCLKNCRTSPNMLIDGTLYTNLTPERVTEIIREIK